jgi:hypothetical protein
LFAYGDSLPEISSIHRCLPASIRYPIFSGEIAADCAEPLRQH